MEKFTESPAPVPPPAAASRSAWVLPAAVVLLIIAAILHYTSGTPSPESTFSWSAFVDSVIHFAALAVATAAPLLLAASLLTQHRRFPLLATADAALAALVVLMEALYVFWFGAQPVLGNLSAYTFLLVVNGVALLATIASLMFLPILRPRAARQRLIALACVAAFILTGILTYALPRTAPVSVQQVIPFLRLPFALAALAALPLAAYLGIRRRIPFAHQPPIDAQPAVDLTCPRCHSAQSIPAGGGQCSACRLQIFIALAEGRCKSCGYALRALTGDKCPECGTAFAPPDPHAQLLAWAAANDQPSHAPDP